MKLTKLFILKVLFFCTLFSINILPMIEIKREVKKLTNEDQNKLRHCFETKNLTAFKDLLNSFDTTDIKQDSHEKQPSRLWEYVFDIIDLRNQKERFTQRVVYDSDKHAEQFSKFLLEKGLIVNVLDSMGKPAIKSIIGYSGGTIWEYVFDIIYSDDQKKRFTQRVPYDSEKHPVQFFKFLLEKGLNVNVVNPIGKTPLKSIIEYSGGPKQEKESIEFLKRLAIELLKQKDLLVDCDILAEAINNNFELASLILDSKQKDLSSDVKLGEKLFSKFLNIGNPNNLKFLLEKGVMLYDVYIEGFLKERCSKDDRYVQIYNSAKNNNNLDKHNNKKSGWRNSIFQQEACLIGKEKILKRFK